MNAPSHRRLRAIVHGRVQGVGFRYFAQHHAIALGLTGFVANQWDGTVALEAEGEEQALLGLLEHLHQGPRGAGVDKVDTQWLAPTGKDRRFRIEY